MENIKQRLLNGEVLSFGYDFTVVEAYADEEGLFWLHIVGHISPLSYGPDFEGLVAAILNEMGDWIPRDSSERIK